VTSVRIFGARHSEHGIGDETRSVQLSVKKTNSECCRSPLSASLPTITSGNASVIDRGSGFKRGRANAGVAKLVVFYAGHAGHSLFKGGHNLLR
jgi:hypothetical protein